MSRKNPNHLLLLCSISHYAKQWQYMKLLFAKASGLKAIRCCSLALLYMLAQNRFKMSVNLRQALQDCSRNLQKCCNSSHLQRALSCTNRSAI